ncbi:MAG: DUF3888 domain-containing protein [Clostridiales bacterium]|nr:DUF3888 domain-containing protein [Clostridiales bacterium]
MRKRIIFASIMGILLLVLIISLVSYNNIKVHITSNNNQNNSIGLDSQVYYNLFITMLYPYVEEAVGNYYDDYMTLLPNEAPYSYNFISIKKMVPELNYSYIVELEIHPYVGPHLSVGRDRITFKIDLKGVKVEKFEHIESHILPPHYQNIIIKELP